MALDEDEGIRSSSDSIDESTPQHDLEKQTLLGHDSTDLGIADWSTGTSNNWLAGTSKKNVVNFLCVLLNTTSTVCIVFINKIIFQDPQFRKFQVGTAAWHFIATTALLFLASFKQFDIFAPIRIPLKEILPSSVLFVGFLILGNLSLALNDVSFYQLAKIMTTPTVVGLNFILFRRRISSACLSTILVSCLGVALTNVEMVTSNPFGAIVAIAAFVITAFYQIWIGKKVEELEVSAPQLLFNQAPVSTIMLLLLLPFTDKIPDFRVVEPSILAAFIFSGILAAGLNLSQFLIIGRTSAVTFNVVSNAKNVIIIVLGWYSVDQVPSYMDIMGVVLALSGAAVYSWLRK
ncbi:hypothetical protein LTR84_006717 [Exophiala bonariae]|uniref:Sugar phosphate transporter domain-containing protein n=1 Tax=Exophiala bonariae TaxID=1690606 RepID=A0AAV9N2V5_9EURO|nr:hypothetical protein LTR84_006717 [Exophiala bonariae]